MAATLTERLSTGATLTWGGTTVLKVVDYSFGGTAPPQDVTGQKDGVGGTVTKERDYIAGLRELDALMLKLIWDHIDTSHALLNTDFIAGTKKAVVFTGPDTIAIAFDGVIEDLSEAMPLGSVITADIVIALYDRDTLSDQGV
jgi:hypothetical protein